MRKHLLITMIACLFTALQSFALTHYHVWVNGTEFTDSKTSMSIGGGTVTWNNSNNTLQVVGVDISGSARAIQFGDDQYDTTFANKDLKIVFSKTNKISAATSGIAIYGANARLTMTTANHVSTTIYGGSQGIYHTEAASTTSTGNVSIYMLGNLDISGNSWAIRAPKVIFDNVDNGKFSSNTNSTIVTNELQVKIANATVTTTNGTTAVSTNSYTQLTGCNTALTSPVKCHFLDGKFYDGNEENPKSIKFAYGKTLYNVWVGGVQAHSGNASDILGDGTASWNETSKTLTLNGLSLKDKYNMVSVTNNGGYAGVSIEGYTGVKVVLKGENRVYAEYSDSKPGYAFRVVNGATFSGAGTLYAGARQGSVQYGISAGYSTSVLNFNGTGEIYAFRKDDKDCAVFGTVQRSQYALQVGSFNGAKYYEPATMPTNQSYYDLFPAYDLYINSVRISDFNKSNLTSISGVSVASGGSAKYNPTSNTLLLNGATITYTAKAGMAGNTNVYNNVGLNVDLQGTNTINLSGSAQTENAGYLYAFYRGININGSEGSSLNINVTNTHATGGAIGIDGTTTVSGKPTVKIVTSAKGSEKKAIRPTSAGGVTVPIGYAFYNSATGTTITKKFPDGGKLTESEVGISSMRLEYNKQVAEGDPYNVWIAGKQVTSKNCDDVLGDGGKVKWDNSAYKLTLNGATINYANRAIKIGNAANDPAFKGKDVTIEFNGTNNITSTDGTGIFFASNGTRVYFYGKEGSVNNITGYTLGIFHVDDLDTSDGHNGKLYFNMPSATLNVKTTTTGTSSWAINAPNVMFANMSSSNNVIDGGNGYGIYATHVFTASHSGMEYDSSMTLNYSIKFTAKGKKGAIYTTTFDLNKSSNQGNVIAVPVKGHFLDGTFYDGNMPNPETITIASGKMRYEVWVGGVQAHSGNASDILGDGSASWNETSRTLTLNSLNLLDKYNMVSVTNNDGYAGVNIEGYTGVKVVLKGANKVYADYTNSKPGYAFRVINGATFSGDGSLYAGAKQGTIQYGISAGVSNGVLNFTGTGEIYAFRRDDKEKAVFGNVKRDKYALEVGSWNGTKEYEPAVMPDNQSYYDLWPAYDLYINRVLVSDYNCNNLSKIDGVSGTVKYDSGTNTLTLNNATIDFNDNTSANTTAAVLPLSSIASNFKVNLIGTNKIIANRVSSNSDAIGAFYERVIFSGDQNANLSMNVKNPNGLAIGLWKGAEFAEGAKCKVEAVVDGKTATSCAIVRSNSIKADAGYILTQANGLSNLTQHIFENRSEFFVSETDTYTNALIEYDPTKAADIAAQNAANAWKTANATILAKAESAVKEADLTAINSALSSHSSLSNAAKAKVTAEKTHLDKLYTAAMADKQANEHNADVAAKVTAWKNANAAILAKDAASVKEADLPAIDAALTSYDVLEADVKAYLGAEKAHLEAQKVTAEADKAANAHAAAVAAEVAMFKSNYSGILVKDLADVKEADLSTIDEALAVLLALSADAQAVLEPEKIDLQQKHVVATDDKAANAHAAAVAAEVAAWKTANADILAKDAASVKEADLTAIDAALISYESLSADAQAGVATEKALLDAQKVTAEADAAANAHAAAVAAEVTTWKNNNAYILTKTTADVTESDLNSVNDALTSYNALSADAKTAVTTEKILLDALKSAIESSMAHDAAVIASANQFRTDHAVILSKSEYEVDATDLPAIDAALSGYAALVPEVQSLLGVEKNILDAQKIAAEANKAAAEHEAAVALEVENYKTKHAPILDKGADVVDADDLTAIDAALSDYDALSEDAQIGLAMEKMMLDAKKIIATAAKEEADAIESTEAESPAISVSNGTISVSNGTFAIYDMSGRNVTRQNGSLTSGTYVVRMANQAVKIAVK